MNWRVSLLLCGLVLGSNSASAQLALPGAAPAAPLGAPVSTPKPRKAHGAGSKTDATANSAKIDAPEPGSAVGQPLMLNGESGLLQISGSGGTLQIDKLRLAGESLSDSSQKCVVDIVGEKPIVATSVGRPDGLERFEVDVPACPFAFDVLDRAVLAPSQITACVFKAADCQTSPGGLWGPGAESLANDAAAIAKQRSLAENAMGKALHALEELAQSNPDAANLVRDQNGFVGERDDQCRSYVKESAIGFCAANLTQARAALLEARLAAWGSSAKVEKPHKSAAIKKKRKPKADAAAAAQPAEQAQPVQPAQ
jgi:hypothetical protein